jgi:hypothetical protein
MRAPAAACRNSKAMASSMPMSVSKITRLTMFLPPFQPRLLQGRCRDPASYPVGARRASYKAAAATRCRTRSARDAPPTSACGA